MGKAKGRNVSLGMERGTMARMVTVVLRLQGSNLTTWEITPQATQDQTLPFTQAQVMALLTSSPDPTIALVTTLEEGFGLAWAQEAFWDTSLEIRGVNQRLVILGEQTPRLPGPHQRAQERAQPLDSVAPKGDKILKTENFALANFDDLTAGWHFECEISFSGHRDAMELSQRHFRLSIIESSIPEI